VSKIIRFFLVSLTLFFIWPFLLLIGFLILVFGGGWPVIFRQKRIGKKGKTFVIYKFRTMQLGAEKKRKKYLHLNEANGPVFKIRDDPRFTKIGKFLSHTGLDELPQLFNILKGEMNLVGPRPLPIYEEKELKKWQRKRESVKPGIISPWLFDGYHDSPFDDWMRLDLAYIKKKSFKYDFSLLIRSLKLMAGLCLRELKNIVA